MLKNTDIKMKTKKNYNFLSIISKIFLLVVMLTPTLANADADKNREELIMSLFSLTQIIAFVIGLYLMVMFLFLLKRRADAPTDQAASNSRIILLLASATFLLNLNFFINIMTQTITGTEYYCFTLDKDLSDTKTSKSCFDPKTSELTAEMRERIDPSVTSTKSLMKYLSLVIGLIQFLGLIFFIKAILMMKDIGQGNGQVKPSNVIVALFFSALIIDLPRTMELISETIKLMGVTL